MPKIQSEKILVHGFIFCVALLPTVSLLWQVELFRVIKGNWLLYPIFIICVLICLVLRRKAPLHFVLLVLFTSFYFILCVIGQGDIDTLLRYFISILPFTFLSFFKENRVDIQWFWVPYLLCFAAPLFFAYLQYTGQMPHLEYDTVDGENVGRITAGYNKPMNFIVFCLPAYLYGFYLVLIKRKQILGYGIIALIIGILVLVGHRTSLIAFTFILIGHFAYRLSAQLVKIYYKYYFHFFVGIASFLGLYYYKTQYGYYEGLRGRIPMWLAHAEGFFNSGTFAIVFGKHKILLDPKTHAVSSLIASLEEVHNNTFRTIVFFGIFGFAFYCFSVRHIALSAYNSFNNARVRFLKMSCFIFLLFFSFTNEPFYYAGFLWPILICILPIFRYKTLITQKHDSSVFEKHTIL